MEGIVLGAGSSSLNQKEDVLLVLVFCFLLFFVFYLLFFLLPTSFYLRYSVFHHLYCLFYLLSSEFLIQFNICCPISSVSYLRLSISSFLFLPSHFCLLPTISSLLFSTFNPLFFYLIFYISYLVCCSFSLQLSISHTS